MGQLDGKVAIVTGAGRGLGYAIAEAYLREGASVTITAAQAQAELDQFVKQDQSERVLAMLADVTNPEACQQVVDKTVQRFGHVERTRHEPGCQLHDQRDQDGEGTDKGQHQHGHLLCVGR